MSALLLVPLLAAQAAAAPSTTAADDAPIVHHERMAHVVGARLDVGRAWDVGLAYLHTYESGESRNGLGAMAVLQYGIDGRLVHHDGAFQSGLAFATGRLSLVGDAGGFGMEASLGSSFTAAAPVVAEGGVFWGVYYVELGYAYRFPIGTSRPDWLASHQFALRIQIPVYGHHERTRVEQTK